MVTSQTVGSRDEIMTIMCDHHARQRTYNKLQNGARSLYGREYLKTEKVFNLTMKKIVTNNHKVITIMGDLTAANASIEKLKSLKINTVYPGHGKPFPMSSFTK